MIDLIDKSDMIKKVRERYTDDELLNYLREFYEKNGIVPVQKDFINNSKCPGHSTYIIRFGSWNRAIEMAGLHVGRFTKVADDRLLEYLKQFYEKTGKIPTVRDFNNNPKYPSRNVFIDRFGSWQNALKLIGLDIDTIVRKGIIENTRQKGRLFEIYVLEHFTEESIDVSGDNCNNPIDGLCPKGQIYDAKSVSLISNQYWPFSINKRGEVDFYYLGGFDKDYLKLLHAWRIPGDFTEEPILFIRLDSNYKYNIENMKEYEITDRFKGINIFK